MKNIILVLSFLCCYTLVSAQIKIGGDTVERYEYMTVSARVTFDSNKIIYQETGHQKSPVVYLPNGESFILKNSKVKSSENGFKNVNEIINYMAAEGWKLNSVTVIQNIFDTDNELRGNRNEAPFREFGYNFLQQLIFERSISKE